MRHLVRLVIAAAATAALVAPANGFAQEADAAVKDAQKLLQSGDLAGAQARFEHAIKADPKSYDAHYGLGRLLDLRGRYEEARREFQEALSLAPEANRDQSLTAMAVSYAFSRNPAEAARTYQRVFDRQMAAEDLDGAAATANAIARVFLESGDTARAAEWYQTGYETAKQISKRTAEEIDLWEFRWEHAQARLAARRKDPKSAERHMQRAKAILDKGTNPDQQNQWPYLAGYVAFYTGDDKRATQELQAADQRDPFILGLLAQAADRLGQKEVAVEYYRKVLATTGHTINAAFSRPQAEAYLAKNKR